MNTRLIAGIALGLLILVGGWFGYQAWEKRGPKPAASADQMAVPDAIADGSGTDTVDTGENIDPMAGATPMAQREAVIGLLNKRNGESRELTLKPGQAVRVGDAIVRLRACEKTAPWEQDQLTGAFVQLDTMQFDGTWRRTFSGWLYKERPGLNVVQNAIYDVWTKSCTMSFPNGGSTASDDGAAPAPSASSAKKSAAATGAAVVTPPAPAPRATPSNATDSNAR